MLFSFFARYINAANPQKATRKGGLRRSISWD
jgi:hypothetical protein